MSFEPLQTEMGDVNPIPFPISSIPGTPLHQLSPDRVNHQRLPHSPSLPSAPSGSPWANVENQRSHRHSVSSDVQSKVAFLNSIASPNASPTRPARKIQCGSPRKEPLLLEDSTASVSLQRAILAREEAQSNLTRTEAELEQFQSQVHIGFKRERMMAERIESLMEELQTARTKQASDKELYVKEIKKARKETYRAELANVQVREELKDARNGLKTAKAEIAHEKAEKEKARQEAFERAYALAGVMEEMELLKEKTKTFEQERESWILEQQRLLDLARERTPAPVIDVAIQTEAMEANTENHSSVISPEPQAMVQMLSTTRHNADLDQTPKASSLHGSRPASLRTYDEAFWPNNINHSRMLKRNHTTDEIFDKEMDGEPLALEEEIHMLKVQLKMARVESQELEKMVHFMDVQCQFKTCPCRVAEAEGKRFVHDFAYDKMQLQQHAAKKRKVREDERARILPPEPNLSGKGNIDSNQEIMEAAHIPLPQADPMELDLEDVSPNATAKLEELTQVLIEPATGLNQFSFSTSSVRDRPTTPKSKFNQSTTALDDLDLFNLSPPKYAPPRPSTSMGFLTQQSPIRLVPESPQTVKEKQGNQTSATAGRRDIGRPTKIALKQSSPLRHQQRVQTQVRPHSAMAGPVKSDCVASSRSTTSEPVSASPAATTVFPVTPVKQSRTQNPVGTGARHPIQGHARSNSKARPLPQSQPIPQKTIIQTTTKTTTVPLRDVGMEDPIPSPLPPSETADEGICEASSGLEDGSHVQRQTQPQAQKPFSSSTSSTSSNTPSNANYPNTPMSMSREEALEQIRARRDRARSVNLKQAGAKSAPGSAKRGLLLNGGIADKVDRRDISQASAPGRM